MARKPESRGACAFCGEELTKRSVAKHIAACPGYQQAAAKSKPCPEARGKGSEILWRIRAQDAYDKDYWLELEMRGSASLTQLDKYLRAIWLECCGHLSEFTIGGWGGRKVGKARAADEVFEPGLVLRHLYDFGTTSETDIRVLERQQGKPLTKHPITLLARNLPPKFTCQECGQPAAWICIECQIEAEKPGLLCEEHAEEHPHENYGGVMPVVNSPRMGMCGYDGPAEPPY